MKNKISVIIPLYNKENYIEQCLKSIVSQTYKNLEILIINDGSIDNSINICEKYFNQDKRIKLVTTENNGASHARNLGISMSTGDFISFIDADDIISNVYYEHLLNLQSKYHSDITECNFVRINNDDILKKTIFLNNKIEEVLHLTSKETLLRLYGDNYDIYVKTVIMCNKLFRKELFENIRYIEGRIIDDETIIYKLIYCCNSFVTTNNIMYGYVQSVNSMMRKDFTKKRLNDSLQAYVECSEFFRDKKMYDIETLCLKRYLLYCIEFISSVKKSNLDDKEKIYNEIDKNFKNYSKILEKYVNKFISLKIYDHIIKKYLSTRKLNIS